MEDTGSIPVVENPVIDKLELGWNRYTKGGRTNGNGEDYVREYVELGDRVYSLSVSLHQDFGNNTIEPDGLGDAFFEAYDLEYRTVGGGGQTYLTYRVRAIYTDDWFRGVRNPYRGELNYYAYIRYARG